MTNMRIPFTIKPDTDAGASHYAKFGVGGYYSVKDISERNSIPEVRLEPGLVVYVKTTHETWQYLGNPDGWSKIIIPNLTEWTDLSERVKFLEDERVWVEESPGESASDFLSEFAGETIYTASEIDEMMARKAEVVDNYYIVAPSCVHYGISSIRVLVYQRNAEFGTYPISQDNLSPVGLQISYKIYNDRDVLLNTISVSVVDEDGGFNISAGNIPDSGRIVITLGVHSPRDNSVVDIYDSHEICVITGGESIPTSLAELTEDSDHRVVTDTEKRTWNRKQNALISGNTIKTINNESLLGSGNITIEGGKQEQADWNQTDNREVNYIKNKPTLGSAAALNVALYGNASETEVVRGDDTRLTDSRTPTSHTHSVSQISDFPIIPTKLSNLTDDLGSNPTHTHSQYLTEHQDISNYIQKSNTSGLVKNDGTIDTSAYLTQHQDISNYIQKSDTSGLVKNDGTIDTNTYLTSAPVTSVNGQAGAVSLALGDANVIESISVNNTPQTATDKNVNITVPTIIFKIWS